MSQLKMYNLYINGKWEVPTNHEFFDSYYPATGKVWCKVARGNNNDVNKAIEAAYNALHNPEWANKTNTERGHLLRKLGDITANNVDKLAAFETQDNGKLLKEMKGQLAYLPQYFYYYAGLADKIKGTTLPIDKKDLFVYTKKEPIGVVVIITPWNSPLFLTFAKLAPAIAAGNTVVIKPSEHASASLLEFMDLIEDAGFPPGVINVVTGFGNEVGDALTTHPKVRRIIFTGGSAAARQIIKNSSHHFPQLSMELGGKSPNIVFNDANLNNALMGVIAGIFGATGQSCVAGSRLFLHKEIYDEFMERLIERTSQIVIGDPMDSRTEVGPVATSDQLKKIENYVDKAKKEGAKLIIGGKRPPHLTEGWYFEPTIFEHNDHTGSLINEEVFGPVLSVMRFEDEEEVVRLANNTDYGLAAGVWTENVGRAQRMIDKIKSGAVWVNTYRVVSPMAPVGGSGLSGYGLEGGELINEFIDTKTVWINSSSKTMKDPFVMR
jgi:acyl-CoA reductase-like NAD-dependent aldehyde dehydrogenase